MFGEQARHTGDAGALRKFVQWSVALAERDGLLLAPESGKQVAKTPDAALIDRRLGESSLAPDVFQILGSAPRLFPVGISDFKQITAMRAAEILTGMVTQIAASNAAEAEGGLTHARCGGGKRRHARLYFSSRRYWSVLLIQSARGGVNTSRSTVSSMASALCGMCAGMQSTSPACTTISLPSIQNLSAPSRM